MFSTDLYKLVITLGTPKIDYTKIQIFIIYNQYSEIIKWDFMQFGTIAQLPLGYNWP